MQNSLAKIEAAGIQLMAISYDPEEILEKFATEKKITFPLLSDPESKVIDSYRLRNEAVQRPPLKGIPHPGTVLVDQQGDIRAKLFIEDYKKRHPPEAIVEAAQQLKPTAANRND